MGSLNGTVRGVIIAALSAARDRRTTWREIMQLVTESFERQTGDRLGLFSSDLEIQRLERCPHSGLASLWSALALANEDDSEGGAWLSGKDFRRVVELVPEWLPAWAKSMKDGPAKTKKTKKTCRTRKGRGVVDRTAKPSVAKLMKVLRRVADWNDASGGLPDDIRAAIDAALRCRR